MVRALTAHLVVPIVDEADARATATALAEYEFAAVTAVHVVEKGGGAPDKLSVEQAERSAEDAIAAFQESIPDAESRITYGEDVVETILDIAADEDASAIAFRPRDGSRVVQFLSGDKALRLVTEADRAVIALQEVDQE
jgi:nucleotide-binding universal stress UspA family protein